MYGTSGKILCIIMQMSRGEWTESLLYEAFLSRLTSFPAGHL